MVAEAACAAACAVGGNNDSVVVAAADVADVAVEIDGVGVVVAVAADTDRAFLSRTSASW